MHTWPLLSQLLPINFANGQRLDSLTMICPDCRREIPEKEIRASVSLFPADVASVRAWAHCAACRRKLTNNFRIRAAGRGFQLEEIHDGFVRVYQVPTHLNFLERVWAALKRLWLWARG
jgi:hypothetical protein